MIVFRHKVTNFETLMMECSGHSGTVGESLECAAASALMAAAIRALSMRDPKRIQVETGDGLARVRCRYDQKTSEIMNMTVCGFEWLAEQAPGKVRCERLRSTPFPRNGPPKKK